MQQTRVISRATESMPSLHFSLRVVNPRVVTTPGPDLPSFEELCVVVATGHCWAPIEKERFFFKVVMAWLTNCCKYRTVQEPHSWSTFKMTIFEAQFWLGLQLGREEESTWIKGVLSSSSADNCKQQQQKACLQLSYRALKTITMGGVWPLTVWSNQWCKTWKYALFGRRFFVFNEFFMALA